MQYEIDDELAFLVDRLAPRRKPFENLTFQEGLRRVLHEFVPKAPSVDMSQPTRQGIGTAFPPANTILRKAPTPSAIEWARTVPELKGILHLTTWKAITDHFDIDTTGDSARRKLKQWAVFNKPKWPPVPEVEEL